MAMFMGAIDPPYMCKEDFMDRTWTRITGLAALISVVMGIAVTATWGNPQFNGPLSAITGHYVTHAAEAQANVDLNLLSLIPNLLFAAGLIMFVWAQGERVIALVALASVCMLASLETVFTAGNIALIAFAGQASHSELRLLMTSTYALDSMQFFVTGLWVGVISLALLRTAIFSWWVCGIGILASCLMLFAIMVPMDNDLSNIGMIGFLLFTVWLIISGISLLWHPVRRTNPRRTPVPVAG